MTTVVGVRFRNTGKAYYYDPDQLDLKTGDKVIVETIHGTEIGRIVLPPREVEDSQIVKPLRKVTRLATKEDKTQEIINIEKEKDAYRICKEKIKERGLDMKLVKAEYTFDNKKVLFYFTADGRIDFRELVKDLAAAFKTRIELRQIGVRDETKALGGIGICGRELCCTSYLNEFVPVSIRMAKEQNLSLNPSKISGVCGRLLCCLKNEQEAYEYLNRKMPKIGEEVVTPEGLAGEVTSMNILRQTVRVLTEDGDDKDIAEFPVDELQLTGHRKKKNNNNGNGNTGGSNGSGKAQASDQKEKRQVRDRGKKNADDAEARESRSESRESQGREGRDSRGRDSRDSREAKENRGSRENRETRENREPKENRGSREDREAREARSSAPAADDAEAREGRSRTRSEMRREAQEARENRRNRMRGDRKKDGRKPREAGEGTADRADRESSAQAGQTPVPNGPNGQNSDRTRGEDDERKHEGRRRRHSRGRGRGRGRGGEGAEIKDEGKSE